MLPDRRRGAAGGGSTRGAAKAAGGDREHCGRRGSIRVDRAAKSPADRYTLYIGNNATVGLNTLVTKKLSFDPLKDLAPVSIVAESQAVLVVHPSVPARCVAAP